jgi:hypothetical protein
MAQLIITSKGLEYLCLYDSEDHELISRFTWSINTHGYAVTRKDGRSILMHRLLLNVNDPHVHCDHVNHNGLDNRRVNIRACTPSQNQHNRKKQNSSTGSKGVTRFEGKYFAQIRCNNVYHYLGLYRSEKTAARVYDQAARRLHGEFAHTNNIEVLTEQQQMKLPI